ncbi:hypothetical protein DPMN_037447 [Dreissena polymorpha]|uniref:Uncharacterized protein n=1 Tax=Dreissena polymorpha TaxID=45954 RepID=A0A9D4MBD3_DREPO|nr:hypothetical protein DPMN_037447 [Dreissena polymorpha]
MTNQQKLVSDQETTITKQKQGIAEQNEKYKALDNLYNALVDKVKRYEDILSTQLASIQSLNNQLDRHSKTVDIHTPTTITDDFRSVLDGSGSGKASGIPRLNRDNEMHSGVF